MTDDDDDDDEMFTCVQLKIYCILTHRQLYMIYILAQHTYTHIKTGQHIETPKIRAYTHK